MNIKKAKQAYYALMCKYMLVYYSVELSSNATLYMPIIQIIFVKKIIQYIRIFCKDVNEKNYTLQVMKECMIYI